MGDARADDPAAGQDWALRVAETAGSAGAAAVAPVTPEDGESDLDDVETEAFDGDDSGEAVGREL